MSTIEETTPCFRCGFQSEDYQMFVLAGPQHEFVCSDLSACRRRQKRDLILIEMQEMAKKPYVHPIDRVTRTTVLMCGFFMGTVSTIGISYLWFGV